jgi:hypothetical protein
MESPDRFYRKKVAQPADCPEVVVELPCAALYDGLLDHEVAP